MDMRRYYILGMLCNQFSSGFVLMYLGRMKCYSHEDLRPLFSDCVEREKRCECETWNLVERKFEVL